MPLITPGKTLDREEIFDYSEENQIYDGGTDMKKSGGFGLNMLCGVLLAAAGAMELTGGNRTLGILFLCLGAANLCIAARRRKLGQQQEQQDHL